MAQPNALNSENKNFALRFLLIPFTCIIGARDSKNVDNNHASEARAGKPVKKL